MEACAKRYGDLWTLRLLAESFVLVSHPELVRQIFTSPPSVMHAGEANSILEPVVGPRSVLLLDEREHMTQRKLLLPPFHGERMERYGELIADACEQELLSWPRAEPLPLLPSMQTITLNVIMAAVFGVTELARQDVLRRRLRELLDWTANPWRMLRLGLTAARGEGPVVRTFLSLLAPVDELLIEEIERARRDPALDGRDDILAMLVQARHDDGSPMSTQELRDELVTLLLAGHETTATALAWSLERLLRTPASLDRLRDEAECGEDAYVDAVIKETLRLRPVIPLVARRLTGDVELGGYTIAAGTILAPCIYLIHRRADLYPEPQRFRPERFLEQPAGTYTWIPFGGGVRRCLGASFATFEMKVVLQTLALRARLAPSRPGSEHVRRRAVTFSPSRGAEAILEELRPARARIPVAA
jgi:cytochrome P450